MGECVFILGKQEEHLGGIWGTQVPQLLNGNSFPSQLSERAECVIGSRRLAGIWYVVLPSPLTISFTFLFEWGLPPSQYRM